MYMYVTLLRYFFIRDLQKDTNFLTSLKVIANERVPYFTQFSTRNTAIDVTTEQDNASRHLYAAGLEQISVLVECNECDKSLLEYEEGSGVSVGLPRPPPPITAIKEGDSIAKKIKRYSTRYYMNVYTIHFIVCSSIEFQRFSDIVLENVIVNIIKEANKGEVSLTAPVYTITKPPR